MSNFKRDLEKMLRNVRIACGLSQREVADMLHINRSTYTYYETGKTSPDLETVRRLAILFSIPPEAFLYPEKYADIDVEQIRVRDRKIPRPSPERLGELTQEEKMLVQAHRSQKQSH